MMDAGEREYQLKKTAVALVIMGAWMTNGLRVYPNGDEGPDPTALADMAATAVLEWLTEIPGRADR